MKYFFAIVLMLSCFKNAQQTSLHNPVLNQDFPDPTVISAPDGKYYAYATNTMNNGRWVNIQVASSTDLFNWRYEGDALPQKTKLGKHYAKLLGTACAVRFNASAICFIFCAKSNDTTYGMCIGVAFSSAPTGPFVDKGTPLMKGKEFKVLDPMAMMDLKTKKKIMYWGSDFAPISVTQLTNDWKDTIANSTKPVIFPNTEKNYTKLIEGAWLDYNEGKYYLYYSGDNCCGDHANYAVMVARADNAFGPFTRLGETKADSSSVILEKNNTWTAPGHNSIVHDKNGNIFIAYHANQKTEADASKAKMQNLYVRRVMCIEPVEYKNGWPVIEMNY